VADELRQKSIHELRGIAQSFGITDIFEKDAVRLAQEIELKQVKLVPPPPILPEKPQYDARLMTKPPARISKPMEITELLEPYIVLGLKVRMDEERWYFAYGEKTDEGPLRMPPRNILICAEKIMR